MPAASVAPLTVAASKTRLPSNAPPGPGPNSSSVLVLTMSVEATVTFGRSMRSPAKNAVIVASPNPERSLTVSSPVASENAMLGVGGPVKTGPFAPPAPSDRTRSPPVPITSDPAPVIVPACR